MHAMICTVRRCPGRSLVDPEYAFQAPLRSLPRGLCERPLLTSVQPMIDPISCSLIAVSAGWSTPV